MAAKEFEFPERDDVAHAVCKADDKTVYRSVVTCFAPVRRQQTRATAFAPERQGNDVTPFTTGEAYFADVCAAIQAATKSVFIAGWQVNWAVKLQGNTRLIDALKSAVENGARVFVMPWLSPKVGIDTGDFGTMLAVFQLNAGRATPSAFCCPAGAQNDYDAVEETFFSHHQKLVVIDGRIAYVGGIDLAFGRRDDHRFSLAHEWRTGPEVYNTGVPAAEALLPVEASAYLSEGQLLGTTASLGITNASAQVDQALMRQLHGSTAGRAVDWAVAKWREPFADWLRNPLQRAAAPIKDRLDRVQQAVTDDIVARMDAGGLRPQHLRATIGLAGDLVQTAYVTLVGASWLGAGPNPMLLRSDTQSMPSGESLYRPDQPRMPWQDVHVRIEGPSVYDLSCNFIRRWNSLQYRYLPPPMRRRTWIDAALAPPKPAGGKGNGGTGKVMVRVLRSAALQLQRDEYEADKALPEAQEEQHEIHDAMVGLIRGAERFVYIENQFFQSECGLPSVAPDDTEATSGPLRYISASPLNRLKAALTRFGAAHVHQAPRNQIARALAERIEDAIRKGHDFHAYIVLPVHPEGSLEDPAIVGQVHWTMQSLVFAQDSLVNRVRVAIRARQLCKQPLSNKEWLEAVEKANRYDPEHKAPDFEAGVKRPEVGKYLTLLNLRNAQMLGSQVRTEQIYVHSKLLIVDDRIVVLGSANINDRSLAGGRDSELALCLTDLAVTEAPLDGRRSVKVRQFAHELRKSLWKKHFALGGGNAIVQPAAALARRLDKPHDPTTWGAIQATARANLEAYAAAFPWVPRDGASIWPVWPKDEKPKNAPANATPEQKHEAYEAAKAMGEPYRAQMPFSTEFWTRPPAASAPTSIRGFICALPMEWTEGQNNHPAMNMILLTQFDAPDGADTATKLAGVAPAGEGARV